MNYLDYIIAAIVLFFAIKGLFKGFIDEFFGFFGLIFAFIIATKFMSNASAWVNSILDIPASLSTLLGFLLIFFVVIIAFQLVSHFLKKAVNVSALSGLEKLGGGAIGFVKGGVIISLVIILITMIPLGSQLIPGRKESVLYEPAKNFAPRVFNFINTIVPSSKSFYAELKESIEKIDPSGLGSDKDSLLKSFQNDRQQQDDKQAL